MGTEIGKIFFEAQDWPRFARRLRQETEALKKLAAAGEHSQSAPVGGFEIEAWLCDREMRPSACNAAYLQRLDSDLATMELAQFNFELNNTPRMLRGDVFAAFTEEMHRTCKQANAVAGTMGIRTLITGILPTLEPTDFCMANMSRMKRYEALNTQIFKERFGRPVELDIAGEHEALKLRHDSVMLEAAATSFQIHTQVPFAQAHHYYNASILLSAPMVAVSANSPFLFGKQLWHETRIPLFEQAVDTGEGLARVSFGSGFAERSLVECFEENERAYDILLPILFDAEEEPFGHLRLHNGTIWRWNRPLIGFDDDGTLHFRIEHRVMPAGPSLADMLANAAFYYGTAAVQSDACAEGSTACDFDTAKRNFYDAARDGLDARITWEGRTLPVRTLILEQLLPNAEKGLERLGIDAADAAHYLGIIEARTHSGRNGARWQIDYVRRYARDMRKMAEAYWEHQQTGAPVHTWEVT
jgi:hypothetical protein